MKIKNILVSLVAILALAAGCNQIEPDHYLNEVKVSSSYVSISMDGGSTPITIEATGSWSIPTAPDWLTISPTSGGAGSTNVTFSAGKTLDGRTAEITINCEGKTQNINVIQGLAVIAPATCAEVLAGPENKTYRVTGVCTNIANTTYGNWYINDGTGEVYIYGTLDAKGAEKNFLSLGIEVGDEVTVEGPKQLYGSTVELVNVTVIKINKSLIKVAEIDPEDAALPIEGGDITVKLTNKGNGIYLSGLPEWLSIKSIAGNTVVLHADANAGGDRSTTVVFKTTDGKKEYSCEQAVSQKGSIIAATVADFLAAPVGDTQYRMSGVISAAYPSDKQGKSFYIKDWSGETLVYRAENFKDTGLKVGDIVTVVGKRGAYNNNPQMVSGTVETVIANVEEISIADFLTKPDDKNKYYMVTGTIKDLLGSNGKPNDYGNLHITDGTNELYVYGCYPGYGATGDNRKFFIKNAGIKEGDSLTMIGYKDTYNGLIELCGGIYFSHTPAN